MIAALRAGRARQIHGWADVTHAMQDEVVAFLSEPSTYGLRGGTVERIDTHISIVFLAGPRAYKLKRAVAFPYLDYATLEKRRDACERELRLNRRTARDLYLAVIAVTREADGRLVLGGTGEPIEWLVEMRRFEQEALLDGLAERGGLSLDLSRRLAFAVAALHEHAQPRRDHGGSTGMRWVVDGNHREMTADPAGGLDRLRCDAVHRRSVAALDRRGLLLDARRVHGLVRQCHGDLHLHNVCLVGGEPTLFDAIEFNDEISCVDVIYDLAFLLMDLLHRGLPSHANAVLNGYLELRSDFGGLALLPLFLSCRAAIRAKISIAQAAVQPHANIAARLRAEAHEYLEMALALLAPAPPPRIVAIGGFSGSGKSTLAGRLAPGCGAPPGAVVLRSDVIRKRLFGVDPLARLPGSAYDAEATARVYAWMLHAAEAAAQAGHSVIVDAVFADPVHRAALERIAESIGVLFAGLWLDVDEPVAAKRLRTRVRDASDATVPVLLAQMAKSIGEMTWRRINGSVPVEDVEAAARQILNLPRRPPAPVGHPIGRVS
ncbi:MAG TPA: AAA family ATPase [Vicinamibacterales bacterium]|nr:AAA family ATPase [Vicinamibacterales bacterium]